MHLKRNEMTMSDVTFVMLYNILKAQLTLKVHPDQIRISSVELLQNINRGVFCVITLTHNDVFAKLVFPVANNVLQHPFGARFTVNHEVNGELWGHHLWPYSDEVECIDDHIDPEMRDELLAQWDSYDLLYDILVNVFYDDDMDAPLNNLQDCVMKCKRDNGSLIMHGITDPWPYICDVV